MPRKHCRVVHNVAVDRLVLDANRRRAADPDPGTESDVRHHRVAASAAVEQAVRIAGWRPGTERVDCLPKPLTIRQGPLCRPSRKSRFRNALRDEEQSAHHHRMGAGPYCGVLQRYLTAAFKKCQVGRSPKWRSMNLRSDDAYWPKADGHLPRMAGIQRQGLVPQNSRWDFAGLGQVRLQLSLVDADSYAQMESRPVLDLGFVLGTNTGVGTEHSDNDQQLD